MTENKSSIQNTHSSSLKQDLKVLYKKWPDIRKILKSIGCHAVEAEDIFQEALVIFCRKKEDLNFTLTVEPFHYVKNTCKLLWYNEARRQQKNPQVELGSDIQSLDDDWFQKEMKIVSIEKAMETLGKQCQQILQLFYGLGWKMEEIAKKVGLRNEKVVKAQKYRCLQKAKEAVTSTYAQQTASTYDQQTASTNAQQTNSTNVQQTNFEELDINNHPKT